MFLMLGTKKLHPVLLKRQLQHRGNGSYHYWKFPQYSVLVQRTVVTVVYGSMVIGYYTHICQLVMKYQRWNTKRLSLNCWTEDDHFRTLANLQNCSSKKMKDYSSTLVVIWLLTESKTIVEVLQKKKIPLKMLIHVEMLQCLSAEMPFQQDGDH